jgi:hypothetical protein
LALSIILSGEDQSGTKLWVLEPRHWNAWWIKDQYSDRLTPAEPEPAWSGYLTMPEAAVLLAKFGSDQLIRPGDTVANLADLLMAPTARVRMLIFEWSS